MKKIQQLTARKWSINVSDLPLQLQKTNNCLHQSLPKEAGYGHSNIFQLDKDLSYIETIYTPAKDLAILSRVDFQEPRMIVTVGLKGRSGFSGSQGNKIIFNEGFTSITTVNSSIGERQYEADKPITQLRFSIGKKWLDRYFGENKFTHLFNKGNIQQVSYHPVSHQGMCAAQQLLTCNVSREIRSIFMHGQAMSLLAAELTPLCQAQPEDGGIINEKDHRMAKLARDILFDEFKNPPSVEMLSIRVGTNQFKLKKLFHHFFKNTPYGLLLEFRMNKAYQLLESTGCQVGVAADFVGYNHASNFSNAFIKHFGISPKTISKKN
ncbi:helix-turn-helix transcriptional regulator [Methylobacter psychrophilus]|uniref:helix-turn-helix transcriptional regulator n=1 Tax=Methylobacter psychrophilus TaxID=96941 RepID=UPI0021D50D2B|nr:AraC family transcriptional regulator [Methylobacter psychrophilus]